jgi:hypothetical protein
VNGAEELPLNWVDLDGVVDGELGARPRESGGWKSSDARSDVASSRQV